MKLWGGSGEKEWTYTPIRVAILVVCSEHMELRKNISDNMGAGSRQNSKQQQQQQEQQLQPRCMFPLPSMYLLLFVCVDSSSQNVCRSGGLRRLARRHGTTWFFSGRGDHHHQVPQHHPASPDLLRAEGCAAVHLDKEACRGTARHLMACCVCSLATNVASVGAAVLCVSEPPLASRKVDDGSCSSLPRLNPLPAQALNQCSTDAQTSSPGLIGQIHGQLG